MSRDHGTEDPAVQAWSIDLPNAGSTRSAYTISARWSDDGSRIWITRSVDPRAWPLLDAVRPDIGALIIIFGVLAILIGIARIFRRPRTAGRSYCRRCNHDLNAVHGERPKSPRCPECGLPLDGRGTARGRARGSRMRRVAIPALAVIACGAAIFLTSIDRHRSSRGWSPAWPVAAAAAVPQWPWWRSSTIGQPAHPVLRIDALRVEPYGIRLESSVLIDGGSPPWVERPDDTVLAWTEYSEDTGYVPRVGWFDTVSGRGGSADLTREHLAVPAICGWSPDGREVVALLQFTESGYRTRDDGSAIIDADVMAVDTKTGAVRTVGRGRGRAIGGPPGWLLCPAIAALGTDSRARAVTLATEQEKPSSRSTRGGLALRELTVIGDAGVRVIPLAGELVEGNSGIRRAWITTDGRLGVEFMAYQHANPELQRGPQRFIDLTSGAVSDPPLSTPAAYPATSRTNAPSPDGSRHVRIEVDWSAPDTVSRIGVVVTPAPGAGVVVEEIVKGALQ